MSFLTDFMQDADLDEGITHLKRGRYMAAAGKFYAVSSSFIPSDVRVDLAHEVPGPPTAFPALRLLDILSPVKIMAQCALGEALMEQRIEPWPHLPEVGRALIETAARRGSRQARLRYGEILLESSTDPDQQIDGVSWMLLVGTYERSTYLKEPGWIAFYKWPDAQPYAEWLSPDQFAEAMKRAEVYSRRRDCPLDIAPNLRDTLDRALYSSKGFAASLS